MSSGPVTAFLVAILIMKVEADHKISIRKLTTSIQLETDGLITWLETQRWSTQSPVIITRCNSGKKIN